MTRPSTCTALTRPLHRRLLLGGSALAAVVALAAGALPAGPQGRSPAPAPEPPALGPVALVGGDDRPSPCLPCPAPAPVADGPVPTPAPQAVARPAARGSRDRSARVPARTPQERGRAALASLRYDWRALGYAVEFLPYRGGQLGGADARRRLLTIYVRPGQSEVSLRATIAHELAHALDFGSGTAERRRRYVEVRGLDPRRPWFPCNGCDDLGSPAGDFAEVFAAWLVGPGDFRSRLAGPPTAAQLRELQPLFRPARPAAGRASSAPPSPSPSPSPSPRSTVDELIGGHQSD